ncbi:MAG: putative sulfate exporter family transporter, partial [Haloferacaceae archaeon]
RCPRRELGTVTPVSPFVVAIVTGVAVAFVVDLPAWIRTGVDRYKLLLETGIVLLGAGLTVSQLVDTGAIVVALAGGVVLFGVVLGESIGRAAGVDSTTRSLLSAGASVCGVSAVLAVAGSIGADEADITYAAGTVLLFDAATLLLFPAVGVALGLPDSVFGVWVGLSLFSTGPAAAVGFAISDVAGQWATVTKLVRNTFIGVLAVGYAVHHAAAGEDRPRAREVWNRFPKFLIGFLLVMSIANAGLLDAGARASLGTLSDWLFTVAFVGLGMDLNPRRLRATGGTPIAVVLAQFLIVTGLGYVAVTVLL